MPLSRDLVAISLIGMIGLAGIADAASVAPPPDAPASSVSDVIQGVSVADPYRWLENAADPQVEAWSDAENLRTRGYLDKLASRTPVKAKLSRLIKAGSPAYFDLMARDGHLFALYNDPALQQPVLVILNGEADPKTRRALIDPNKLDGKGLTAIDWYQPSADGTKVAVSLSKNGSEDGVLHVFDVATGKEIGGEIPRVQYPTAGGSLAWNADGSGFWYTRYPGDELPEAERHFNVRVYFHRLGGDWHDDALVLGPDQGLERVSEVFLDTRAHSDKLFVSVQRGDGNQWAFYVADPGGQPVQLASYDDHVVSATLGADGAVYAISRADAPKGKILKLAPPFAAGTLAGAPVLIPEGPDAILSGAMTEGGTDLTVTADRLFVRDIAGGPNRVRIFDHDGQQKGTLPLPDIAGNGEIEALANGDVLFDVTTYLRPRYFARWSRADGSTRETALKIISPVSFADAEVVREMATSKDGTEVPVNIIRKKGTRADGQNPVLLYGYGGYGISQTPVFLGAMRRLWLDAGGVYAIANIRGGAEFGENWHKDGMLTKKQNVFDDFAAVANHLVNSRLTSHARLAIMGGSNGGLLMGAMITQHPDLARAVVSAVGIYDSVRSELEPNGAFNITEFGTVKDPAQFAALYAYSPYHHVEKGQAYPAVLMLTGATDGRVNPMHSRKMTAALQAASGSANPILLRTSANSGHGIGSSLDERIAEQTDELTFLFDQLGMDWRKIGK